MPRTQHAPIIKGRVLDTVLTWIYMMDQKKDTGMWVRKDAGRSQPWHYITQLFYKTPGGRAIKSIARCGIQIPVPMMVVCPTPPENKGNPRCRSCASLTTMDGLAE